MLLWLVVAAFPIFQLSVYKLLIGVRKRLDGLMTCFLWKGSRSVQCRGQTLVSWDSACRPIKVGGLSILDIHKMNMTLLAKWVARFMSFREDLVTQALKESCTRS